MNCEQTTEVYTFESTASNLSEFSSGVASNFAVWQRWYVMVITLSILIISVAFAGNSLTLVVFFKYMSSSMKTATNYLVCSLSFADLISTFCSSAFVYYNYFPSGFKIISNGKWACLVTLCSVCVTLLSSILALFSLNLHRLFAVLTPHAFKNQTKRTVILIGIVLPWSVVATCVSLPLFGWNTWSPGKRCTVAAIYPVQYIKYIFIYPCSLILLLVPLINIVIFILLFKGPSKVKPDVRGPATVSSIELQPGPSRTSTKMRRAEGRTYRTLKTHREISKMLLVVVGTFYACLFPWVSLTIASQLNKELFIDNPSLAIVFELSKPFLHLNGALNPLIYANRNSHFKKGFKKMFAWDSSVNVT